MNVSLDLLRSFLAVHRSGSVTAAAQVLGLAQPTVTAQLKALEAALGRTLFDRLPRGVAPTAAADELARRVAEPLDALESVTLADDDPAAVHVGGPAEFVCEQVLPALAGLIAGGLQVRTTFGLPDGLLDGVADGRLDLAVLSVRPRRRGIVAEAFYDEEFALVAAPVWADRLGRVAAPGELSSVPLIAYGEEAPILRRYWRTVFGVRLTRTPELVVPDLRGALAATLAGAGATVLPEYLCHAGLDDGALRLLAEPELPPLNTLFLAYRPPATARRAVAAVRERLLGELRR
ncbi:LysR family transcriptional regulator [Jiangella anatolica]|uniref:LysR family transcriptional regulator n=1 Tax=Jiangella anatolica TaxID=2670374 RepID=A0A2W2C6Q5_9ACTN|nr:LysR family transcriptional regulator [Jiangella anatolica]PZF83839.1 LysR family transcriptional regulator [Jiangella anatolica]